MFCAAVTYLVILIQFELANRGVQGMNTWIDNNAFEDFNLVNAVLWQTTGILLKMPSLGKCLNSQINLKLIIILLLLSLYVISVLHSYYTKKYIQLIDTCHLLQFCDVFASHTNIVFLHIGHEFNWTGSIINERTFWIHSKRDSVV